MKFAFLRFKEKESNSQRKKPKGLDKRLLEIILLKKQFKTARM